MGRTFPDLMVDWPGGFSSLPNDDCVDSVDRYCIYNGVTGFPKDGVIL